MDPKNRKLLIGVLAAVALVAACGCAAATLASAASWVSAGRRLVAYADLAEERHERVTRSFAVGDAPVLEIAAPIGKVSVRARPGRTVQVVADKRGTRPANLAAIDVSIAQQGDRVIVRAKTRPAPSRGNVGLTLEIAAPPETRLVMRGNAGEVEVQGLAGGIDVDLDAGAVRVDGATGNARLRVRAGEIRYAGDPTGDCHFEVGLGEIALRLPQDADLALDLEAELGTVDLDVPLDGSVSTRRAAGTLGDGSQGEVYARAGAGSVRVSPR